MRDKHSLVVFMSGKIEFVRLVLSGGTFVRLFLITLFFVRGSPLGSQKKRSASVPKASSSTVETDSLEQATMIFSRALLLVASCAYA